MTTHITLRLAWHNDGWNGRICKKPAKNSYCVGCSSYPGEMIREQRNLDWEKKHAGQPIATLDKQPACMYSASAFSDQPNLVNAAPPSFFKDKTETKVWEIPASTALTWPYEAMYKLEGVREGKGFNYDKRLEYADEHFTPLQSDKSLVFYYANYSNPLSDDERPRYLLIGVARIKEIAPTLFYDNCSEKTIERYKGFIWQRGITSHYPDQGFRLPYHRYIDRPSILKQFAAYPENNNLCKYATKHVSDDEALGLLEQLLESARIVRDDIHDNSENWDQRILWLESLISEFWKSRGAFPGMPAVLDYLGLGEAISGFRNMVEQGKEQQAVEEVADFLDGKSDFLTRHYPLDEELDDLRRNIMLTANSRLNLLVKVLARCAFDLPIIKAIMSDDRINYGITASLDEVENNPYLLAEQFTGIKQQETLRWSVIDRGMIPSPELFADPVFKNNAKERLRSIILETIRGNHQQTFTKASLIIEQVNARVQSQPDWKQCPINLNFLKVDQEFYSEAIKYRKETGLLYLYDLLIWNDERLVSDTMNKLLTSSHIRLPHPVPETFWSTVLFKEDSPLADKARERYQNATQIQAKACKQIINKRVSVITGGAGTGKSTIVSALIKAIWKSHGEGESIAVIAPTGKATDRLRRSLGDGGLESVATSTIHSILAKHGWLNDNLTFRARGGKRMASYNTVIIDESSMIDLALMAALFRAIEWGSVSRLILVGDAAQLPPIGIGKIYADTVTHLRSNYSEHYVELTENLRQLVNTVEGNGNGILELADCFINSAVKGNKDQTEQEALDRERLIRKIHEEGNIDKDLRVIYWSDSENLHQNIINRITEDLKTEANQEKTEAQIWGESLNKDINSFQILSSVRGELYGSEAINHAVQSFKSQYWLNKGSVDSFTLFDKVIQIVNRPTSRAMNGYNFTTKSQGEFEVFNGEIGCAVPTGKDWRNFKQPYFKLKQFAVKFSGKPDISINYFGSPEDRPEANLELAYAISVHKSQGSEFQRVYFVLPSSRASGQIMELIYTALTRASVHCTVFVQDNVSSLINAMRPEQSALKVINSSLFNFCPVPQELSNRTAWYEAGKVHKALTGDMVRSKSEVIIANILADRDITFWYEKPLFADNGTMYLPDFTLNYRGKTWYWEHLGMMDKPTYQEHWKQKEKWYNSHFPGQLITTSESATLSHEAESLINSLS